MLAASVLQMGPRPAALYNQACVQKFAFLVSDRAPGTVEKGSEPARDGPAEFPTGWFESRERMHAWLTA